MAVPGFPSRGRGRDRFRDHWRSPGRDRARDGSRQVVLEGCLIRGGRAPVDSSGGGERPASPWHVGRSSRESRRVERPLALGGDGGCTGSLAAGDGGWPCIRRTGGWLSGGLRDG